MWIGIMPFTKFVVLKCWNGSCFSSRIGSPIEYRPRAWRIHRARKAIKMMNRIIGRNEIVQFYLTNLAEA